MIEDHCINFLLTVLLVLIMEGILCILKIMYKFLYMTVKYDNYSVY